MFHFLKTNSSLELWICILLYILKFLHICSLYLFGVPVKLWINFCANSLMLLLLVIGLVCVPRY